MLNSVKMPVRNGVVNFPEEVKQQFLESGGLNFMNYRNVSAEEIWDFMTDEAPRRFPYFYNPSLYAQTFFRFPDYLECLYTIKFYYMILSFKDRYEEAKRRGTPIVFIQGGQNVEPYYAAGAIPARPFSLISWGMAKEGITFRELSLRNQNNLENARRDISPESCHMISAHQWIKSGFAPVDLVAPCICLRCSDMAYLTETHRSSERKTPIFLVDYPIDSQPNQEWTVEYLARSLHRLVEKIAEVGGKVPANEEFQAMIKMANRIRRVLRDYVETWRGAEQVPSYCDDYAWLIRLSGEFFGDPIAASQIIQDAYIEIKERVDKGIRGTEIVKDPVRLFVCGSCYVPHTFRIEKAGGAVVGYDDFWNRVLVDVEEEGDPYKNMAKAMLSFPYERPTIDRAHWEIEQIIKSRADGVILAHQWGCNVQSAVSRMMGEIIKKETGIPVLYLELDSLTKSEGMEQSESRIESFIEMLS